jgi:hypothetical protein
VLTGADRRNITSSSSQEVLAVVWLKEVPGAKKVKKKRILGILFIIWWSGGFCAMTEYRVMDCVRLVSWDTKLTQNRIKV